METLVSNSEIIQNNKLNPLVINKIKNRKVWCAASTHSSEELICAKTHIELKRKYSNVLTIIIPRHIHRVEKSKKNYYHLILMLLYIIRLIIFNNDTDILLIDAYGESLNFIIL